VAAIFLAGVLVKKFSGKGLVPDALVQSPQFAVSIALGAALTVLLATKTGMPVSTTHSLVGALFGSGVLAVGNAFNFTKLGHAFLVPLLVSPLLAAGVSLLAYAAFKKLRQKTGITKETCVCVGGEYQPVAELAAENTSRRVGTAAFTPLTIAAEQECVEMYRGKFLGINAQKLLDYAHYLSAGVVSFARGLNDTPKIAGLLLVINALDVNWGLVAMAVAIALGGWIQARKVGETVSRKITPMNHGQGFTANLVTGLLVTTASLHGLPVSTTHVSVGSIFGIGTATRKADTHMVSKILFSWLLTLPVAAIFSAGAYWLLMQIF